MYTRLYICIHTYTYPYAYKDMLIFKKAAGQHRNRIAMIEIEIMEDLSCFWLKSFYIISCSEIWLFSNIFSISNFQC